MKDNYAIKNVGNLVDIKTSDGFIATVRILDFRMVWNRLDILVSQKQMEQKWVSTERLVIDNG
jgi:hypothetical protein